MDKIFLAVAVSIAWGALGLSLTEKVFEDPQRALEGTSGSYENRGPDYYRLPKGVTPLTYELRMIPFLDEDNQTFKGDVTIKLLINSATSNLTLHSSELNVSDIRIFEFDPPNVEIPVQNFRLEPDRDFLVVESQMTLLENKIYVLRLKFEGELGDSDVGFFKSSYEDSMGRRQWLAATQFEGVFARTAFPCFDEPHLRANFSISIARPRNMNTLSNMNLKRFPVADPTLPDNYIWDHYEETPKMPTYLVAFIVSNLSYVKAEGHEFRVWTRREYINDVAYSLRIGPTLLEVMKNITGIAYSLPKMDIVAVPGFGGAMENWGLVTQKESMLLFNDEESSAEKKQHISNVVAHELAHQWFGNLVSPEWWTWIWLNEGFATYYGKLAVERIEPSWRMMEQFVVEDMQPALLSDSFYDRPMNHRIEDWYDVEEAFDDISYEKAGSVIRMMSDFLSESTFSRGLATYLNERKYNSATDTHLFEAMDTQALIDQALPANFSVKTIMSSWSTQAGHPVITVKRDYLSGRVTLKQERYSYNRSDNETTPELWWVPIKYTSQNAGKFNETKVMHWMKDRSDSIMLESLPAADEWILFNLNQIGFYRVNYDDRNWMLLSDYLNSNEYHNIPPVERAMLIDDAFNLARAGYINYSVVLNLTSYLHRESDYIPLYAAHRGFNFLESVLSRSNELTNLKVHMRKIMTSYFGSRIFEVTPVDDHVMKLSRTSLLPWACKYNKDHCISKAIKLLREWRENSTKSIPFELKRVVYCFGIQGGTEDWDYVWNAYQNSSVATEKDDLLLRFGCSRNETEILGIDPAELQNETTTSTTTTTATTTTTTASHIASESPAEVDPSGVEEGPFGEVPDSLPEFIRRRLELIEKIRPEIESWLSNMYRASSGSFQLTCNAITILIVLIHFLIC
ncbi:aminopeptidase N-like isoform X1 [Ischnura elegans]|uniref:aminopeptidase N-like isoform X1 n=2 Tax=Ischnura elegans TaxID=197161 RepID=UPI001ED88567|nr:aminopeptidase N-like isoform X1 [Ischnura elegans]XP_046398938.1 aminopeptidase N-like isoform X1 [Ischnura elegans]